MHRCASSCTLSRLDLREIMHSAGMAATAVRMAEQMAQTRCWKERTLLDQQNLGASVDERRATKGSRGAGELGVLRGELKGHCASLATSQNQHEHGARDGILRLPCCAFAPPPTRTCARAHVVCYRMRNQ